MVALHIQSGLYPFEEDGNVNGVESIILQWILFSIKSFLTVNELILIWARIIWVVIVVVSTSFTILIISVLIISSSIRPNLPCLLLLFPIMHLSLILIKSSFSYFITQNSH